MHAGTAQKLSAKSILYSLLAAPVLSCLLWAAHPTPAPAKDLLTDLKARPMPIINGVRLNDPLDQHPELTPISRSPGFYTQKGDEEVQVGGFTALVRYSVHEGKIIAIKFVFPQEQTPIAIQWLAKHDLGELNVFPLDGNEEALYWQRSNFVTMLVEGTNGYKQIMFISSQKNAAAQTAPEAHPQMPPEDKTAQSTSGSAQVTQGTQTDLKARPMPIVKGVRLGDPLSMYPDLSAFPGRPDLYTYSDRAEEQLEGMSVVIGYSVDNGLISQISIGILTKQTDKAKKWLAANFGEPYVWDKTFMWERDGFTILLPKTSEQLADIGYNQIVILLNSKNTAPQETFETGGAAPQQNDPRQTVSDGPVIMGVRLGDSVDKYKNLREEPGGKGQLPGGTKAYQLTGANKLEYQGLPLSELRFMIGEKHVGAAIFLMSPKDFVLLRTQLNKQHGQPAIQNNHRQVWKGQGYYIDTRQTEGSVVVGIWYGDLREPTDAQAGGNAEAQNEQTATDLTAKPRPVILGIRLGDKVDRYPNLIQDEDGVRNPETTLYIFRHDLARAIGGAAVEDAMFVVRKGQIIQIYIFIQSADKNKLHKFISKSLGQAASDSTEDETSWRLKDATFMLSLVPEHYSHGLYSFFIGLP